MPRKPVRAQAAPTRADDGQGQLSVRIPTKILQIVHEEAAKPGQTLRSVILRALKSDGYPVPDKDMVDRRAEARRLQAELYRQHKAKTGG